MKIEVVDKNLELKIKSELQDHLIFMLRNNNYSLKEKIKQNEYCLAQNYEKGWKDAVKKIDNFIERHCKEYE